VVVGLVSVASIASFKRHLGRLPGVQSVGVSSGPDGEFLFAVNHAADASLRDLIPGLPSFQARVTGTSDGVLNVTAHDPEADN
jgi:predicted AlkP superfamily pyrophosphatase or phosphodiesterase